LWLTEFDASAVDIKTGKLDATNARTEVVDWIALDVPVRETLRVTLPEQSTFLGYGPSDTFRRKFNVKSVAIVQGAHIRQFLEQLRPVL
jgi:hypothetical protein